MNKMSKIFNKLLKRKREEVGEIEKTQIIEIKNEKSRHYYRFHGH